jgi:exodeoxyribonuclease VII small subunit
MSNAQTFEQSLSRLEEVVARLEGGDLPLDEALERYEEGVRLVSRCRTDLERAELKVKRLVERNGIPEVEDVSASGLFGGAAG